MENVNGVDLSYLRDEAQFIETLTQDEHGNPLVLDYWQRKYIRDARRSLDVNKSRQVGFSFVEASKGLARAMLRPAYRKFFVSINLNESKDKIRYARQIYSSLPDRFKLKIITDAKTEFALEDSKGRISQLKALTSREPRGMNGDITLDEFAHYKSARKILDAAGAVGIRGGWQLSVGSSPLSQDGPFWEITTNFQKKYSHFGRYSIPWWLSRSLCTNVEEAAKLAKTLSTAERVERYGSRPIKEAFAYYTLEAFVQEYECGFIDEASAFMPYDLIRSCWEEDYGEEANDSDVRLLCRIHQYKHGDSATEIPEGFWVWVRNNCKGLVEIGIDIGREIDITAIVVTDEVNGIKEVRAILTMMKAPFPKQEAVFSEAVTVVNPVCCRIDRGNMGIVLCESMVAKFGERVEPVNFTLQSKAQMATNIKARFEKKIIRIPAWQTLANHIHSIKRSITAANNQTYDADASEHHGDIYWALGLTDFRGITTTTFILPSKYHEDWKARKREQEMKQRAPHLR